MALYTLSHYHWQPAVAAVMSEKDKSRVPIRISDALDEIKLRLLAPIDGDELDLITKAQRLLQIMKQKRARNEK
jgi:hypothetical protein